ncbi:MAG: ABC transporter permease [Actinobacteria bacterium]|nr:ABC transporter permease [Actinomycetota bacterium]
MNLWALTEFTLREAFRRRVVLLAGIVAAAFLALYGVGVWFGYDDLRSSTRLTGSERTLVISFLLGGGLWSLNFAASLLAIFLSVGEISGEIDQGTMHAVASRPVRRMEIVVGKFLGYAALIAVFIIVTTGTAMAIVGVITRYVPGRPWAAPLLMLGGAVVLLTLSIAGSSRLSSLANGVVVFTL